MTLDVDPPPGFFDAPRTSFNGTITGHRAVALTDHGMTTHGAAPATMPQTETMPIVSSFDLSLKNISQSSV